MYRIALIASLLATPAAAQQVIPCDWIARADAIVEPWEDHTATFANGKVRLALMDVIEPAAGASHILILSPPYDEIGNRQCRTLGLTPGIGFNGMDWDSLRAAYDPAVGLMFEIHVEVYNGEYSERHILNFTLNQATGEIRTRLR